MKVWEAPPPISAVAGVGPEVRIALPPPPSVRAEGVATVAVACPVLLNFNVTVMGSSTATGVGAAEIVAVRAAAVCTTDVPEFVVEEVFVSAVLAS